MGYGVCALLHVRELHKHLKNLSPCRHVDGGCHDDRARLGVSSNKYTVVNKLVFLDCLTSTLQKITIVQVDYSLF